MSTGWQCVRICHQCTGTDWHDPRDSASWNTNGPGESPFKSMSSPFLDIPGCSHPKYAQLDYCHAFHLGTGMDMGASCIVLLCKLGHFGNHRALDNRLWAAFGAYRKWCRENHRVTNITSFSKLAFDMKSTLLWLFFSVLKSFRKKELAKLPLTKKEWDHNSCMCKIVRNNDFPTSLGGKAYDTAIVLAWLEVSMALASASLLQC